jgi:hypothetical protein
MLEKYHREVIKAYQIKRDTDKLPDNLARPTDARLKAECLKVFKIRYTEKDNNTFSAIFESRSTLEEYYLRIKTSSADKFKSLKLFLIGKVDVPQEKTVELLAWIIDFEPRPATLYYRISSDNGFKENSNPTSTDNLKTETPKKESVNTVESVSEEEKKHEEKLNRIWLFNKKLKKKIAITTTILTIILYLGGYLYIHNEVLFKTLFRSSLTGQEKCMYWTGEHYETIGCNETNATTIPLDTFKLAHFQRITLPDTLTKNSLGKVWYGKVNGKPIFYTAGGEDPLDSNKRLLPMTNYIKTKYTSNYRYLLHLLIWSFSFFALITLLAFLCYRYFSKSTSIPLLSSSKKE